MHQIIHIKSTKKNNRYLALLKSLLTKFSQILILSKK